MDLNLGHYTVGVATNMTSLTCLSLDGFTPFILNYGLTNKKKDRNPICQTCAARQPDAPLQGHAISLDAEPALAERIEREADTANNHGGSRCRVPPGQGVADAASGASGEGVGGRGSWEQVG